MNNIPENIKKLGLTQNLVDTVEPEKLEHFEPARVVAVHKDSYTITNGEVDVLAELVGKIIYSAESPLDFPAVGDWVLAQFYDDNTFSIVHEILPRQSLLKRKTPGKKVDFQLIAANIDIAFIVQSLNENFNIRRLERYLVMVNESKIQPIVLLSKSDLIKAEEIEGRINEIKEIMPDTQILPFSNENETSLKSVRDLLKPGMTHCLLGSSGVGKTTLLNNLVGEQVFKTKTVSKKESKGRHATTSRQLTVLPGGAMMVDTPGMRELGNISIETGLDQTFSELSELAGNCRFSNCTHVHEKGCAILQAVADGQVSADRHENYIKMHKESVYNEMSYLEKRRKDKEFGKHCKRVMKHKKSRR